MVPKVLETDKNWQCVKLDQGVKQSLGLHLSNGQLHPEMIKTAETAVWPLSKIKKEVRPFLELAVGLCLIIWSISAY